MQRITASFVNPPKQDGGKYGSIKATDGKYYSFEWARYSGTFRKGGSYDVEVEEKPGSGGKVFFNIVGLGADDAPRAGSSNGSAPPPDRWWINYASNVTAHAIAAGLIKDPSDIETWALAAKAAIFAADGDDNVPF